MTPAEIAPLGLRYNKWPLSGAPTPEGCDGEQVVDDRGRDGNRALGCDRLGQTNVTVDNTWQVHCWVYIGRRGYKSFVVVRSSMLAVFVVGYSEMGRVTVTGWPSATDVAWSVVGFFLLLLWIKGQAATSALK